jgi:UDP-N-acetylmuramate--alanine ligase
MRLAKSRVHFIGVGGIGMCGLAELLHNMGVYVQGSDVGENQQTLRLRELGIHVEIGHAAENVKDVDVVVFSSAVKSDNIEFRAARTQGIPLIPRAEALAEIMRMKRGIAVGGTHGKTTTTSIAAAILLYANMDPTIVIGGRLDLIKSTAKLGSGEWLIAEADESDGSFSKLSPEVVIVTNVDDDHMDHYKNMDALKKAFLDFSERIPFYGLAVVCGDSPDTKAIFKNFSKRIFYYGFADDNDFQLVGSHGQYTIRHQGQDWARFQIQVPGRHNALNALAAILAARQAGVPLDKCCRGVENYSGVDRRMQLKYDVRGIRFYDDYGHHPTEVRAVLQAMREKYPDRRLVVIFQPHRYSRTELCWDQFKTCFKECDLLFLLDVYPAGESPIPGIDSKSLIKEIQHPKKEHAPAKTDLFQRMRTTLEAGDVVLTLGAGDVWKLGDAVAQDRDE